MFHRHSPMASIEGHLRAIEGELAQLGRSAGRQAATSAYNIGDRFADAADGVLNEIAERYRSGARLAGNGAQRLGNQALSAGRRMGHDALDGVSAGVERRPIAALAVAVAVGMLIGFAGRKR